VVLQQRSGLNDQKLFGRVLSAGGHLEDSIHMDSGYIYFLGTVPAVGGVLGAIQRLADRRVSAVLRGDPDLGRQPVIGLFPLEAAQPAGESAPL